MNALYHGKWLSWHDDRPKVIPSETLISDLLQRGIHWLEIDGTDYPIFRVGDDVQKKYDVFKVADLPFIPFPVLWPQ
jgi:hypothetical protein